MKDRLLNLISRRAAAAAALALAFLLFAGWKAFHDDGMVGATKKNGFGCTCHSISPADSVVVWIEGPARVQHGRQARYRIMMTGGPAVEGGFNLAAGRGMLAPADTTTQLLSPSPSDSLELTHFLPQLFAADTVRWEFLYTAPADTTLDTLYSVGNSANGDGTPTGDAFNFGADLVIDVTNDPVLDVRLDELPRSSALFQNYPNPFNPATTIRYDVGTEGQVELSIYDVGGRLVARPVGERRSPGSYAASWNAGGLPSGIYFSRLSAPGLLAVRKMLLLR